MNNARGKVKSRILLAPARRGPFDGPGFLMSFKHHIKR